MKRTLPPPIATDEQDLFRAAVGDVRPLASITSPPLPARPLPRRLRMASSDVRSGRSDLPFSPTLPEVADQLSYLRAGCDTKLLRQLRRGKYPVQDNLDLHQMTVASAHASLTAFIACIQQQRWRCVRIVHGKGLRSGSRGPLLKKLTDRFLRESSQVLAFAAAPAALGGSGAVLVLLRASHSSSSRTTTVA